MKKNYFEPILGFITLIIAILFLKQFVSVNTADSNTSTYNLQARFLKAGGIMIGNDVKMRVALCFYLLIYFLIGCEEARKLKVNDSPSISSTRVLTPPQSPLIALTPSEYNNTISDLLALPRDGSQWPSLPEQVNDIIPAHSPQFSVFGQRINQPPWPWEFPKEVGVHEFEGMADGQIPSPYLIEKIKKQMNG